MMARIDSFRVLSMSDEMKKVWKVMRWRRWGEKSSDAIMGKMKTFLNFVQGGSNYYNEYNFLPCCNVPFESIEVGSCEALC